MLDVVDPELDRLGEADRTDVPGDLDPLPVGLFDRGGQVLAADARVRLQPRRALGRPVAHEAARLLGRVDQRHPGESPAAGDVRRGDVDPRTRRPPGLDLLAQVDLRVRLAAPRGAHGGDPAPQVEARRAVGELRGASPRGRVVEVIVQPDQPGNDGVAGQVHDLGAARDLDLAVGPHGSDAVALDHDGLAAPHGSAGPVDEGRAGQSDDVGIDGHVVGGCRARDGALGAGRMGICGQGGDGSQGQGGGLGGVFRSHLGVFSSLVRARPASTGLGRCARDSGWNAGFSPVGRPDSGSRRRPTHRSGLGSTPSREYTRTCGSGRNRDVQSVLASGSTAMSTARSSPSPKLPTKPPHQSKI